MSTRGLDLINHTITEVNEDAQEPAFIPDIAPNLTGTFSPQQALMMGHHLLGDAIIDEDADSEDDDDEDGGESRRVIFNDLHEFLSAGQGMADIFEGSSSSDEEAMHAQLFARRNSISDSHSQRPGSARLNSQSVTRVSQPTSPTQNAKSTKLVSATITAATSTNSGDTEPLFFTPSKHGFWAVRVPKSSPSDQRLVWYRHVGEWHNMIKLAC